MKALIRKEIRLLFPTWAVAMLLAVLPSGLLSYISWGLYEFPDWMFSLGALLLPLASFGQELSAGTFSSLLSQPVSRQRIWRVKVITLAVAVVSCWLTYIFCHDLLLGWTVDRTESTRIASLAALVFFSGGLWTTLLLRQVAGAFFITVVVPLGMFAGASMLDENHHELFVTVVRSLLVIYVVAGFLGARWMFLRAQDAQWTGGTISMPGWLNRVTQERAKERIIQHRPWRALIRKEIQLHQVSLFMGAAYLPLHLAAIGVRKALAHRLQPDAISLQVLGDCWLLWLVLPILVGAMAVADERRQGTLASQLSLPISRTLQFIIKLGVVLVLGLLLGCAAPVVLEKLAASVGVPMDLLHTKDLPFWGSTERLAAIAAGITIVAFYASTLTRNLLQAMAGTIAVAAAVAAFGVVVDLYGILGELELGVPPGGPPLFVVPLCAFIIAFVWLGYRNYNVIMPDGRLWFHNFAVFLVAMAGSVFIATVTYNRVWEFLTPIEPRHGPAKMAGSVRPRISVVGMKTFALLPDGRLWSSMAQEVRATALYERISDNGQPERPERMRWPVPVTGAFVGGSNWVATAVYYFLPMRGSGGSALVGLKSDGTLWRVFSAIRDGQGIPMPESRMGSDSDWAAIAGSGSHCLALKRDGSLWGFGNNNDGEIGPTNTAYATEPKRIGTDTDWVSIFAPPNGSVGIKRDGTVWRWGFIPSSPKGESRGWTLSPHPEPLLWRTNGSDWIEFETSTSGMVWDLVLKQDGTLWVNGNKPFSIRSDDENELTGQWKNARPGQTVVAINSNGRMAATRVNNVHDNGAWTVTPGFIRQPSRYADWETTYAWGPVFVALAADGTLCCWAGPDMPELLSPWLGPTRKPLWSMNIFEVCK